MASLNNLTKQQKNPLKCEICEEEFKSNNGFKKHFNIAHNSVYSGDKNHRCDICGNAFTQAGSLKTHINAVHNGKKDHQCNSC